MARASDGARTAAILLKLHGDDAEAEARRLWQLYRDTGATTAARVWENVLCALRQTRQERVRQRVLH